MAYLPPLSDEVTQPLAFDTGPANVLIDVLMTLVSEGQVSYDEDGRTAAAGTIDEGWIETLLDASLLSAAATQDHRPRALQPGHGS